MILRLKIGNKFNGIEVVQDAKYPTMWRVRRADGSLTDMVNLARAKDAAMSWLCHERGRGISKGEVATWVTREAAPVAPPIARNEAA